jgi:hypothetical protein
VKSHASRREGHNDTDTARNWSFRATIFLVLIELRHFCPNGRALYREALELMSPEDLELSPAERLLRGPLQHTLADHEEIRMLGREGRIVDLGAPLSPLVVGDLRQLPPRADQPFGESCLVEYVERAWMDREGVTVLGRPPVHVDDLHTDPVLLQEQGRDETDRTGTNDEDLRIGATEHRLSRARRKERNANRSPEAPRGNRDSAESKPRTISRRCEISPGRDAPVTSVQPALAAAISAKRIPARVAALLQS